MAELFEITPPAAAFAEKLNPQQSAAVYHGEGPLLVVAGAGTGKTRVITERIRHLLDANPELPGEAILGLTFTDKAAAEMKARLAKSAGERGKNVFLGTFHSFCNAMLLERNPSLQTLGKEDHWILLRRNLRLLALERYRRLAEPGQFLGDFVQFFSRCQDELVTPDDYEKYVTALTLQYGREKDMLPEDECRLREELIAQQQEVSRAYRASDRLLRERNLLTFGMQLMDAVRTMDADTTFAAGLRERFRYILVDEFQDTNVAQIELLLRLANQSRNIVAVGDSSQAIYRFRGASFGSFTIFLEKFAGVPQGAGSSAGKFVQQLADNYRSSARVLRIAGQINRFIERSPLLPKGDLVAHKPDGDKVRIAEFTSPQEEARWIASEIVRLHAAGQRWRSFAALYRIHSHREQLVAALEDRGIPFVIRNLSILGHPLVRDVLAYLRLLAAPSDNIACARVLAAPAWGWQPADLVRLCERASKTRSSLWDSLYSAQAELPFEGPGFTRPAGTAELVAGIDVLRKRAKSAKVSEIFDALSEWLGLSRVVPATERRYLDRVSQFIREWQPKSATSRLAEFDEYLDYFQQAGGQINLDQDGGDAVQLMTVHSAKGLEFDHVFVLRLTSRGFPMAPRAPVLEFPEDLMKEELPKGDFHTQEERRLFYVAATRARERLTLTTVVNKYSKPSVFLDDILSAPSLAKQNVEQSTPVAPPTPPAAVPATAAKDETLFASDDAEEERRPPRVYSRIASWALQYRPPVFEPLQLSHSSIGTYQTCPQKYLFANVWGLRGGPSAAITFGNVMHNTIRLFVGALRKGTRWPFEEVVATFEREWISLGFEDFYQEELYRRDGIEQLRAFHASCLETPPDVFAQEKRFVLDLESGVQVTGRMDQVNRLGPSEVEIVDYKTGKPKTETQAQKDLQLSVYALAAKEDLGMVPTRLVYYNLQNNECVASVREETMLKQVRGTIQDIAGSIRAREFPVKPGFACKFCDFRVLCPAQEPRGSAAELSSGDAPNPSSSTSSSSESRGARAGGTTASAKK